jgi:tRNA G10  N-methylase Trm11
MKTPPEDFELEKTTVWSFPKRGNWATHNPYFRGNWAPQIPRNLMLRYTKESDFILDPMCGCGTTLIECKLLGRKALGLDINPENVLLTKQNIDFEVDGKVKKVEINIEVGDARNLSILDKNEVDFIATHPPYLDIIKYSEGKIAGDLSNIHNMEEFCMEIKKVADEFYRVLKPKKYCAILIGDTRRKTYYIPLAYKVMQQFLDVGFKLKEDITKVQWNCETTPYWCEKAKEYNFLLIMHEHLFVFEKS